MAVRDTAVLVARWYAHPNDVIGGWCVMPVDQPPSSGVGEVADFASQAVAEHIADLHNAAIDARSLDADRYARDVAAAFEVPGVKKHHRLAAQAVLDGLGRDGLLRTSDNLREVRAFAIREAIGAVAAYGPGVDWPEELERFAQVVGTEDPAEWP